MLLLLIIKLETIQTLHGNNRVLCRSKLHTSCSSLHVMGPVAHVYNGNSSKRLIITLSEPISLAVIYYH